jgi:hypothetical protein
MSDTPRTDAATFDAEKVISGTSYGRDYRVEVYVVDADFARDLERECGMLRAELRRAEKALYDSLRHVNTILRDGWETLQTDAKRYDYLRSLENMPCGVVVNDNGTPTALHGEALDAFIDARRSGG